MLHLKEAMRSDHSRDMSAHILTWTSYDFNILTLVLQKLQRW